ncbi:ankyrin repeat domain-containing, partial [Paramuricea clavata]
MEDSKILRNDLEKAIMEDDVERLKKIIEEGHSSRLTEIACGYMSWAVYQCSVNCFEYLCGAYEQLTNSSRTQVTWHRTGSPFFRIVKECNWAAIRIAEKHGDLMNYLVDEPTESQESTPLLIAIQNDYEEVAKWLIKEPEKKPDIEKRNAQGESPIYLAALKGQAEIIKEMLEIYSCSPERREILFAKENLYGKGHSIFYPASQSRKAAILDVLMEEKSASLFLRKELQHSEFQQFVLGSCLSGSEKILKAMLEVDQNLPIGRFRDEKGATSLMR